MTATRPSSTVSARPALRWIGAAALSLMALAGGLVTASSLSVAQGFKWPWDDTPQPRKPLQQPAPAWRPPPEPNAPPVYQPPPIAGASQKAPICLDLERRLVQEGQNGNQSRDLIPMVENQLRQVDLQYRTATRDLDRANCYEYFLFQKTLRRTQKCLTLVRQSEELKRQLTDLETQRQQLSASTGRSYQDEIVRELANNNCGAGYSQQAARRDDSNPFSSLWQEESPGTGGGYGNSYSSLPYATYRTVCVRLCDGYYFPISFSTLPNHFERDAEACSSKCAAPAELFYYQNPGGAVEQMVGAQTNIPYAQMKTAFRYRKEYVNGCSCKPTEYMAGGVTGQQGSGVPPPAETASPGPRAQATEPATSGWSSEVTPTPQ